jgi:hypothetical protein
MKKTKLFVFVILLSSMIAILAGRATTPVKLQPVAGTYKIDIAKYDTLTIKISKFEGVEMSDEEAKEMRELIAQAIEKCHHSRFQITDHNPNPNALMLEVKFMKFPRTSVATALVGTSPIKAKILFMN